MMILLTAALAAAVPAVQATPRPNPEAHEMAPMGKPEQADCCPCCKDMAKEHEGNSEHAGHSGR